MATEYVAPFEQTVNLNSPVVLDASIPCRKGYIWHEDGSGIFILRGVTNNCSAQYQVNFAANIAIPEGGTLTPIAIAIVENGEQKQASTAIYTPAAVGDYGFVAATGIVKVPRGCCFTVAIEYVSGVTDGTTTPTPAILVRNSNLTISRIA